MLLCPSVHFVTTVHDPAPHSSEKISLQKFKHRVRDSIRRRSHGLIVLGESLRPVLAEYSGIPEERIHAVPHGEFRYYSYFEDGTAPKSGDRREVLFFGRWDWYKGLDVLAVAEPLITAQVPNAKIIHVKRNPVDTCVSAFTRLFNKSQHQSYDLSELGRYYRDYLSIMAHWRSVLPADAFYEIEYEQLVANQEEESKKLIAYCGLEWSDACLNPHKTERNVKTASVIQVRQPVYTSSVERWRVYEPFLGPLLAELRDVLPAN